MKVLLIALILFGFSFSLLASESADNKELKETDTSNASVVYRKTESLKFSGLNLKGQLKKPDLSYIYKRAGLKSEQIVDIPEDFNDEILKGAEAF